ncbi:hypothetical protein [Guptibacillus algicola]|uniref:hypothetical protein n=1 Tax=Guptibacillus algicola TaxID=225844 RepID=UPI001CD2F9BA|nr:hypothetical protein [Alkalihalobacillus algicola]MCA0986569.1 hypothetical protein [Alkalihalobacillus algicola]
MNTLHDYERYLCNNFILFSKEIAGVKIPKETGVYMLGVSINNHIMPVYLGRACGNVQHLWLRSRRYLRVLYGHPGDNEVIDTLLKGINNHENWYISWIVTSADFAKELEYKLLRNTTLKLVNAIGMRKGCKKQALNNALWYLDLYKKFS